MGPDAEIRLVGSAVAAVLLPAAPVAKLDGSTSKVVLGKKLPRTPVNAPRPAVVSPGVRSIVAKVAVVPLPCQAIQYRAGPVARNAVWPATVFATKLMS